jgi:hypothetical protein
MRPVETIPEIGIGGRDKGGWWKRFNYDRL